MATAILITVVVAGFMGLKTLRNPKGGTAFSNLGPVRCALKGKSLAFFDSADTMLWNWPVDLPADFNKSVFGYDMADISAAESFHESCVDFADIDEDGHNEAAVFLFNQNPEKRTVALFDHDKKILWEQGPAFQFVYPAESAENDRYVRALSFQKLPGRRELSLLVLWNVFRFAPSAFEIRDLSEFPLRSTSAGAGKTFPTGTERVGTRSPRIIRGPEDEQAFQLRAQRSPDRESARPSYFFASVGLSSRPSCCLSPRKSPFLLNDHIKR